MLIENWRKLSCGIISSSVAFDLDQFGSPTVLIEPGIDPSQGYSDIVGIVKVADVFFLAFVSDTETTLREFRY